MSTALEDAATLPDSACNEKVAILDKNELETQEFQEYLDLSDLTLSRNQIDTVIHFISVLSFNIFEISERGRTFDYPKQAQLNNFQSFLSTLELGRHGENIHQKIFDIREELTKVNIVLTPKELKEDAKNSTNIANAKQNIVIISNMKLSYLLSAFVSLRDGKQRKIIITNDPDEF